MLKQILLLLSFAICCNLLFAQVTFNYTGILGIEYKLDQAGGFPIVPSTIVGGPAYLAGIKADDRMLKINDQTLSGITLDALTEKFKIPMGVSIKILVEHEDKTQQEVVLKKAGFISASYKVYKYMICFDENKKPLTKDDGWVYYSNDGLNGIGYYVYDATSAFYGEFENGNRKEGLYYYVENGKPEYYLGEFVNNKYSGKGMLSYTVEGKDFTYTGDFMNGMLEGTGVIKELSDGSIFTGSFKAGQKEGYGKETAANGSLISEGQWVNGVLQNPSVSSVNYNDLKYAGYTPEQIKEDQAYRRAGLTEIEIEKMNAFLNSKSSAPSYSQNNSGSSSSAFENEAASITASQQQSGWQLYESFDVSFSQYSIGTCFTSCSEHERDIYIIAEEASGLRVSDLLVSYAQRSSDISDYQHLTSPFEKHSSQNGIAVYGHSVKMSEINSGCTYQWTVSSGDATTHRARILVFWGR